MRMRLSSFKARIFLIAVVVSTVLIGFTRITTYLIIVDQMDRTARIGAQRVVPVLIDEAGEDYREAERSVTATGLPDAERARRIEAAFIDNLRRRFGADPEFMQSHLAFYDRAGSLRYASSPDAQLGLLTGRAIAAGRGEPVADRIGGKSLAENLLGPADLGSYVVHVPLPGSAPDGWVTDIVYHPKNEMQTIDALRAPMIEVGVLAIALTGAAMMGTTLWVLGLVDELRRTADSIDAGHLETRMPERGANEVGDLARSLNALLDRLSRASEAQTRFVADASHELATPVAGIRGHINILRTWGKNDPAVRDESLDAIDRESRRMVRLTRQLLESIRSDAALSYAAAPRDCTAIARRVLADAATRYAAKGLEFVGPEDEELEAWIDPERVEQLLGILVDNAAKYTPAGGRVEVATHAVPTGLRLVVSDNGRGIPPEAQASIFDRFYRADPSRASEGFGLGLSIAKRIVDTAGGDIEFVSAPGQGTTFTVTLPGVPVRAERGDASSQRNRA